MYKVMILLWRRKDKMERACLEKRLQNYNRDLSKYVASVERRKRAIVQEFDSVKRTSGNSPCGLPSSGRQTNVYAESRYSKSGFRLSEKRLMGWKQAERELERFLRRTQIGKPPTSHLVSNWGKTTTKCKKCLNLRRKRSGERTLKEQTEVSQNTAKIFRLYLENDNIKSKLEHRTPVHKTPRLDKNDFIMIPSTADTEDHVFNDEPSGSDDSDYDDIPTSDLNFNGSESPCFYNAASFKNEESQNIEDMNHLKNGATNNKQADDACFYVIDKEVPGLSSWKSSNSRSSKKRLKPNVKSIARKPSCNIMRLNNNREFRNQQSKRRISDSVKESGQKPILPRKTDMLSENAQYGKNIAAFKNTHKPQSRDTNEVPHTLICKLSGTSDDVGDVSADKSISTHSSRGCPLVNTKKKPQEVDMKEDSKYIVRTKSEDKHRKISAKSDPSSMSLTSMESSYCDGVDQQSSIITSGFSNPTKPESTDVKFPLRLYTNTGEQTKSDKQLTFQNKKSPSIASSNDVKFETSFLKCKVETSLRDSHSQRKLGGQIRRKSTEDSAKTPKTSLYRMPTRPSTTPVRQPRLTTDVRIEYPPAIHTKMSLECFFKTALVFSKSTRKTRLERLVDEFSPDINERMRQERICELKDHSLHLSYLANKFNLDNPHRSSSK